MPGVVKRKKLSVAPVTRGGLSNYTNISKATTTLQVVLDKNHLVDSAVLLPTKESTPNSRKRRLSVDVEESTVANDTKKLKSLPQRKISARLDTPKKPKLATKPQLPTSSPSKQAANILDQLRISAKPQSSPSRSSTLSSSLKAATPKTRNFQCEDLPAEILDLLDLHSAFLTTLSIQYAHNGIDTPVDLRALCPDTARSWGKRKVLLEDVQRTIGVLNLNLRDTNKEDGQLSLSDYGHGKICVEIEKTSVKNASRPIDEDLYNTTFRRNLLSLWEQKEVTHSVQDFITSLPQEQVRINSSLSKISPLLAKGQQRLESFKADIAAKQDAKLQAIETKKSVPAKLSLLDRLRAKQLAQSTLAPGMTKDQIARRAALGRAEEVVAILGMMSSSGNVGQSRVSFTMGTIVTKLKDSFKTPISKDESEACLKVLAEEVAPEWVKLVKMGKVEALVVNRQMRLGEVEVRKRIDELRAM